MEQNICNLCLISHSIIKLCTLSGLFVTPSYLQWLVAAIINCRFVPAIIISLIAPIEFPNLVNPTQIKSKKSLEKFELSEFPCNEC